MGRSFREEAEVKKFVDQDTGREHQIGTKVFMRMIMGRV